MIYVINRQWGSDLLGSGLSWVCMNSIEMITID